MESVVWRVLTKYHPARRPSPRDVDWLMTAIELYAAGQRQPRTEGKRHHAPSKRHYAPMPALRTACGRSLSRAQVRVTGRPQDVECGNCRASVAYKSAA